MSIGYWNGIDTFASDAHKPMRKDIRCLACGSLMPGEKYESSGSLASAIAKKKTLRWNYFCPNTEKEGHAELVDLHREIEDLASEKLRAIVRSELEEKRERFMQGRL